MEKIYLVFALFTFSFTANAQWDHNQNSIWNTVESGAAARRMKARMEARRKGKGVAQKPATSTKKSGTPNNSGSAEKPKKALRQDEITFFDDPYNSLVGKDSEGYKVILTLTPVGSKGQPIVKMFSIAFGKHGSFYDLPVGVYMVEAQAVYKGKTYPAKIGANDGNEREPNHFKDKFKLEVKAVDDETAEDSVIKGFPYSMYIQVYPLIDK